MNQLHHKPYLSLLRLGLVLMKTKRRIIPSIIMTEKLNRNLVNQPNDMKNEIKGFPNIK